MKTALSDVHKGALAGVVVVLCWSGFNIVSRFGSTGAFTPFDLAPLRFGVSGPIALPLFIWLVPPREWPRYMVLALFGGLGYGLLVYSGFKFAPSAHAGVFVNGGIPFRTVIMLAVGAGFRIPRRVLIALLLSTTGLVLIGSASLLAPRDGSEWIGDALFLAAAWTWAVFGLLMRRWQIKPQRAILGIASFSAISYLPVYFLWRPKTIEQAGWGELLLQGGYQGIIAALLAAGMYSYANQKIGAYFLLDESISLTVGIGILVVSAGAAIRALQPTEPARAS